MKLRNKEAQNTPNGINSKQSTPTHILIQLSKAKDQKNPENKNRQGAVPEGASIRATETRYPQVRTSVSCRQEEARGGFLGYFSTRVMVTQVLTLKAFELDSR